MRIKYSVGACEAGRFDADAATACTLLRALAQGYASHGVMLTVECGRHRVAYNCQYVDYYGLRDWLLNAGGN